MTNSLLTASHRLKYAPAPAADAGPATSGPVAAPNAATANAPQAKTPPAKGRNGNVQIGRLQTAQPRPKAEPEAAASADPVETAGG